jgi:MFS family permease
MSNTRSVIALCIVALIIAIGIAGWLLDNEILQAAFIVLPVILIAVIFGILRLKNQYQFARLLYSKKEFDRVQSSAKTWTYKNYLMYFFGYGTVALIGGIGFLYLYYISGSITALLFGLGFAPSGLSSILMGSVFKESDMHTDLKKKEMTIKYARMFLMMAPIIVIAGIYLLPTSSIFQGDLIMMNMFGLLIAFLGIASLPLALWRMASALNRSASI